jgi:hypothetical protein
LIERCVGGWAGCEGESGEAAVAEEGFSIHGRVLVIVKLRGIRRDLRVQTFV